ncbi:hypothetical protein EUX98_g1039 [Antrodiella citrinella]|uniref:Exosome complex protein n=1 Tax=Antrodiella citrinella TaxID=2447956 RepID=A0A4V3XJI4_9APHY|nr:hypothetical protein EUX98_g1039 [Antrodiella citrinella]
MSDAKIRAKLKILNESLDELDETLEPLFAQTLPEVLAGLETLQQAKLQVDIPYVVYDLVFSVCSLGSLPAFSRADSYCKKLDGVRQYFDKIKKAEEGPEKRKNVLDQGVANRFIKHAIAQVNLQRPPADNHAGPSDVRVPVKVTSKMAARAQYEKELEELGDEEASDLEVFEDEPAAPDADEPVTLSGKSKEKGNATESVESEPLATPPTSGVGKKRRRAAIDPFAGYGDSPAGSGTEGPGSGQSTPMAGSENKNQKKAAKKARKKAKKSSPT